MVNFKSDGLITRPQRKGRGNSPSFNGRSARLV